VPPDVPNCPLFERAPDRSSIDDRLRKELTMSGHTDGITTRRNDSLAHLRAVCEPWTKICPPERATALLEAVIAPGDRVTIEGGNQKQAELLAAALANVDPARVHGIHMVQSVLALPEHLAVFERGITRRLDFSFAGP
jgi:malonate decarboxylase alpha subunit